MAGISIEEKIKLQQHLIDNFQLEKENLLNQIAALEKSNDDLIEEKEAAYSSAKEMINTMEKEFEDYEKLVREFHEYKEKYKSMFIQLDEIKHNYETALKEVLLATKTAAVDIGAIKKPSLLDKIRGKK